MKLGTNEMVEGFLVQEEDDKFLAGVGRRNPFEALIQSIEMMFSVMAIVM